MSETFSEKVVSEWVREGVSGWVKLLSTCPFCGVKYAPVRVHGHEQCATCGAVVERCCDE